VRNEEFMAELRHTLRRPWSPPTPAFAVRLAAPILRTDPALALSGRRGVPKRLTEAGFHFQFPTLGPALEDLLG
jgi:NAD dependent epimerase/dehydratase family enzyme